ncbi:hypothetical protein H9P43_008210 [Blastocladiella emersonii ATCC 22665]|nr:hypothetical protein H9P43_008210 [Blastocladiella emersonii ATCC 22665]
MSTLDVAPMPRPLGSSRSVSGASVSSVASHPDPTPIAPSSLARVWNLKSATTQTDQSDFPATQDIAERLSALESEVDFRTAVLHETQQRALHDHFQSLREHLADRVAQLDRAAETKVRRARTAAQVELASTLRAVETAWAKECERRCAEAEAAVAHTQATARAQVREARVSALAANDQALLAKAQLAKLMQWMRQRYGEPDSRAAQECLEADETSAIIVELQRRVDERDQTIADLTEVIERFQATGELSGGPPRLLGVGLHHSDSTSSFTGSERSSSTQLTVPSLIRSSRNGPGSSSGGMKRGRRQDGSLLATLEESGDDAAGGAMDAAGSSELGGHPGDASQQQQQAKGISEEELQTLLRAHEDKVDEKWKSRTQKLRLQYETQASELRNQLARVTEQLELLQKSIRSVNDPSKMTQIVARQRAILDIAAVLMRPPTPPPPPPPQPPSHHSPSMSASHLGSGSRDGLRGSASSLTRAGDSVHASQGSVRRSASGQRPAQSPRAAVNRRSMGGGTATPPQQGKGLATHAPAEWTQSASHLPQLPSPSEGVTRQPASPQRQPQRQPQQQANTRHPTQPSPVRASNRRQGPGTSLSQSTGSRGGSVASSAKNITVGLGIEMPRATSSPLHEPGPPSQHGSGEIKSVAPRGSQGSGLELQGINGSVEPAAGARPEPALDAAASEPSGIARLDDVLTTARPRQPSLRDPATTIMYTRLSALRSARAANPLRRCGFATTPAAEAPTVGIRRETKHKWERRTPVLPEHVSALVKDGIRVVVQPSTIRVVGDERYRAAGAEIAEDLSSADVIVGIKEVEPAALLKDKAYLYFSHTHKAQPYNMPMLQDVLDKKIRLLDYELITDDHGRRQVMFGTFAGYAGMLDGLHAMGLRMLAMGFGTPFLNVGMAHTYPTLNHAKNTLRDLGKVIAADGLPRAFGPVVVTFTGTGNVSLGAQEVFKCLPHEFIKPADLQKLVDSGNWDSRKIYATVVDVADHVVRRDGKSGKFDFAHYLANPAEYTSEFATKIAPYTTLLVTGHYWDTQFPRLITTAQAKQGFREWQKKHRMITIADVSCDIGGALEFMSHAAKIDDPWFMYNPATGKEHKDIGGEGIQIMSVDILPAELPLESSQYFGDKLLPYLKDLAKGKFDAPVLARATIAADGKLLPRHAWLNEKLPKSTSVKSAGAPAAAGRQRVVVLGSGFVAGPLVDYLLRRPNVDITLASNNLAEAQRLASTRDASRIRIEEVEVHPTQMNAKLAGVLKTGDVVVSLVPASLHIPVAQSCIDQKIHLVTASYISPAMQQLDAAAQKAGVTIMNEVGLDPGIDHLTAKQFIDEVHAHGGQLEGFVSWCGGLPAPEDSGNPLGYKFSWSPRGVLLAAMNAAVYRKDGKEVHVPSEKLLQSAQKVNMYKGFALEGLPNRDSLAYIDQYQLDRKVLQTMFRGTLRYEGYSRLVHHMRTLGLLGTSALPGLDRAAAAATSWPALLASLLGTKAHDAATLETAIRARLTAAGAPAAEIAETVAALSWMGMFDASASAFPAGSVAGTAAHPVALDATCAQLQAKLVYGEGERDMVAMHHEFTIRTRAGKRAHHTATMVAYGDPLPTGYTAMAKTVGLPAAIAAEMLLEGKIAAHGVLAPMARDVYEPMLGVLHKEGIKFVEKSTDL